MTQDFDTQVPHSISLEQELLGAALFKPSLLDTIAETVSPAHFFEPLHQDLFDLMLVRSRNGDPIGAKHLEATVATWERVTSDVTVPEYLRRLHTAGYGVNVRSVCKEIVDLAARRALLGVASDMHIDAINIDPDHEINELIEEYEGALQSVAETGRQPDASTFGDIIGDILSDMDDAIASGGRDPGLPVPFSHLEQHIGGFEPGNVYVVAGRPAMGKTALAMDFVGHLARRHDIPCLVFSMEMTTEQLVLRELTKWTGIPMRAIKTGRIEDYEARKVRNALQEIGAAPIVIEATGGLSIEQLTARARRLVRKHKCQAIVVDYLQLMRGRRPTERVQELSIITAGMKTLAKNLSVAVILLSQLSRQVEQRENKRPQLSDLRESGSIEQDADVVMFVYRDEYYLEREEPPVQMAEKYSAWQQRMTESAGKAEIIIAKNRQGETGTVSVHFDGSRTRFSTLEHSNRSAAA